jgi:hypothetical protein
VQPGSHAPFHATLGVTIRAATNGTASVPSPSPVAAPPGQAVHLADLFVGQLLASGECTLDRCILGALTNPGACVIATNARLRLH